MLAAAGKPPAAGDDIAAVGRDRLGAAAGGPHAIGAVRRTKNLARDLRIEETRRVRARHRCARHQAVLASAAAMVSIT